MGEGVQRARQSPAEAEASRGGTAAALQAVSERALRAGAQAGFEALARAALGVSGASGVLLQEGRRVLGRAGLLPPGTRERAGIERLAQGPVQLLLRTPALSPACREALEALLRLVPALLAAREREAAARAQQARLRLEARAHAERAVRLEARRSRASHDLRTPLVVMKGYVDMIQRGMAGPLSPALQRYAERLARAVDEQNGLIARHLAPERGPSAALLPVLRAALARRVSLQAPAAEVHVRAHRAQLTLLARTLAATLPQGGGARLQVEAVDAAGPCELRLVLPAGAALAPARLQRLEALAAALCGQLQRSEEGLTLLLPRAAG